MLSAHKWSDVPAPYALRREGAAERVHGLALGVEVGVSADLERHRWARVAGELPHDLGVHALQGEHRHERVPELVERHALQAEGRAGCHYRASGVSGV